MSEFEDGYRAGIEEAAKVCETPRSLQAWMETSPASIAAAIRALPVPEQAAAEDEIERAAIEVGVKAYFSSPDFWTTRRCVETAIRTAILAARKQP